FRAAAPPDLECVAKALRRDEGGLRAATLKDAVDDDRRTVLEHRSLADVEAIRDEPLEPRYSPFVGQRCRRDLAETQRSGRGIVGCQIGERPTDIDPDHGTHARSSFSETGPTTSSWSVP